MKNLVILALALSPLFSLKANDVSTDNKIESFYYSDVLPQRIDNFIKKYFPKHKVLKSKSEITKKGKVYEVKLNKSVELEFDTFYRWKKVEDPSSGVPSDLVPMKIESYIKKNYSGKTKIKSIEKDGGEVEVKLQDNIKLIFSSNYNFLRKE